MCPGMQQAGLAQLQLRARTDAARSFGAAACFGARQPSMMARRRRADGTGRGFVGTARVGAERLAKLPWVHSAAKTLPQKA